MARIISTIAGACGSTRQRADELLVDLEHVERQSGDRCEVGMAGAEIVDCEPHAAIAQRPHDARHPLRILTAADSVISSSRSSGFRPEFVQRLINAGDEIGLVELVRRNVDGDALGDAFLVPSRGGKARIAHHAIAQLGDQPRLLGDRNEHARRHHAAIRTPPARQRLGADQLARLELHLGLEHRHELAALEPLAQFGLHARLRPGLFHQAMIVESASHRRKALGFLQRDFALLQSVDGRFCVSWRACRAERGRHANCLALQRHRLANCFFSSRDQHVHVSRAAAGNDQAELVGADAAKKERPRAQLCSREAFSRSATCKKLIRDARPK